MLIEFVVEGTPVAKGRPRLGKFGTYTPEKTTNYETLVKTMYMVECKGIKLKGPLEAFITAYFPIPKSDPKPLQEAKRRGLVKHLSKPDWDNIGKIVCDALNETAYHDDSYVCEAHVRKLYSDTPRMEIKIVEQHTDYDEWLSNLLENIKSEMKPVQKSKIKKEK